MKYRLITGTALILMLFASEACAGDVPASPPQSASVPQPALTPESTPSPEGDQLAACAAFIGDGGESTLIYRIPDAIKSLGASATHEQIEEMLSIFEGLVDVQALAPQPSVLYDAVVELSEPFEEFVTVVSQGSGHVHMDTSQIPHDVAVIVEECVDAGY